MLKSKKYKDVCEHYGIKPLGDGEKDTLTESQKVIRQSKIDIVNMCEHIRETSFVIESMIKKAPEDGDPEYVAAVVQFKGQAQSIMGIIKEMIVKEDD